jgi:hypothetical protein
LARDTFSKPILPDIPDLYADRLRLTISVFGVNITFGLSNPHPEPGSQSDLLDVLEMVRVRMSLEHTKIMAMLLKKQIKIYEQQNETIVAIPRQVLVDLDLTNETW